MEKRLNCGVYFAFFLLQGLYNAGYANEAFNLLNGKDEHSWYQMLQSGATACMEVWSPEQKHNTSWCHPWSSSPIYFYVCQIMGVQIQTPNGKSLKISPHIPADLSFIELDLPLPSGMLSARFTRKNGIGRYEITAPKDVKLSFENAPNGEEILFIEKERF